MDATLTGDQAAHAVRSLIDAGNADARFDRRRLLSALRAGVRVVVACAPLPVLIRPRAGVRLQGARRRRPGGSRRAESPPGQPRPGGSDGP